MTEISRHLRMALNPVADDSLKLEDFHAYMPMHSYIYEPTCEMWPACSVNSRIPPISNPPDKKPLPANQWLDQHRPVEQMTWAPGLPTLIEGKNDFRRRMVRGTIGARVLQLIGRPIWSSPVTRPSRWALARSP